MSSTGGEIKSTLSLDVSQFATNLTKAIEGLDGLDKRLQSALKIAEGFDKGIAGIGTGMNSVAERFKMLDQTLSTLVTRMTSAAERVGSIGGRASDAAVGVERLGSAMKSAGSMNADAWIGKYEGKLNELAPAIRSTVQAILDLDRAKIASAEKSETASVKTAAARLKELEAEKRSNGQIIAERKALAIELDSLQSRIGAQAASAYADASRFFGKNAGKGALLREEAAATEAVAIAIRTELAALQSVVKEMQWKNTEVDRSIKAINAETRALEVRTKAEKDFAAAVKSSVNQAMQNPAGDYSMVRSGRIVPVQNPELLMNFPPRAEFDRAAQIAADNAAQAIRRAKSLVAIATANATGDYSTIGGKLKTVHNPEFLMNFPSRAEFEAHADKVAQDAAQAIRRAREMVKRATANAEGSYTDLTNYSTRFVANPRVDMMFPPRELFEQEQNRIRETAGVAKQAEAEKAAAAREAAAARRRAVEEAAAFERAQAQSLAQMWRSMGQLWAASKIEGGLKASVGQADQMERQTVLVKSLNYNEEQNAGIFADARAMSNQLKFISTLDAVKSRMSAIASIGHDNAELIDKTLSMAVKAANNLQYMGVAGHGDLQTVIRNLYGVVEMRQQTNDPNATNNTFELMQKIIGGTQGKVQTADMETVLRRIGMGAGQLSDHGMLNLAAIVDQFKVAGGEGGGGASGGVSTVGTAFKMMQAYAIGKGKTAEAVKEFAGAGILDTGTLDLSKDSAGVLKDAKNGNFKDAELWMSDPVAAVQKIMPKIVEYTQRKENVGRFYQGGDVNDPRAQLTAVAQYLARLGITTTAAQAMMTAGDPRSQERIKHQVETMENSKGINQVDADQRETYGRLVQETKVSLENLGVMVGNILMPALKTVLKTVGDIVRSFSEFARENPLVLQLGTVAAAIAGVVLAFKGFTSMFGVMTSFTGAVRALAGTTDEAALAARRQAAAQIEEARATVASTAAAKANAEAELRKAQAHFAATGGMAGSAQAHTQLIAANTNAKKATDEHAKAVTALNTIQGTTSTTSKLLGGALNLLGGPIGIVTTALTLGIWAWDTWGNAAEKAANKAASAADRASRALKGMSSQKDLAAARDELQEKQEERKGYVERAKTDKNYDRLVSEKDAQIEKIKNEIVQHEANIAKAKADEEETARRLAKRKNFVGPTLTGDDDTVEEKDARAIAEGARRGKKWRQVRNPKTGKMEEQLVDDPKADAAVVDAATAAGHRGAHRQRNFEDAFAGKYQAAKSDLEASQLEYNSTLTGEDTFEARAKAEFMKMWQRGDFDDGKDPSKRKFVGGAKYDKVKGWGVDQIQWDEKADVGNGQKASAADFAKQIADRMRVTDAIKAQTFANERAAAADKEAELAAERLADGGIAKKTDAYRALEREFAREEERTHILAKKDDGSYVDDKAATAYLAKKKDALAKQAEADLNNYAVDQIQRTKEMNAELLDTERARLLASQQATRDAEDAKWQAVHKTFEDQMALYDKDSEKYKELLAEKKNAELLHSNFLAALNEKQAREREAPLEKMVREWKDTDKQINDMTANWGNGVVDTLSKAFTTGKLDWKNFLTGMLGDIQKLLIKDALGDTIKDVFGGLGGALKGALGKSASAWSFGPGNINDGAKTGSESAMGAAMKEAGQKALEMWNTAKDKAGTVFDEIGTGFGSVIRGVGDGFGGMFSSLSSWVQQLFSMMSASSGGGSTGILGSLVGAAVSYFTGDTSGAAASVGQSIMGDVSTSGQFGPNTNSSFGTSGLKFSTDSLSISPNAMGGIMTSDGPLSLKRYANGGIASSPQLAMFGEGMLHEAYVPLPDGRSIPVTINGGSGTTAKESSEKANVTIQINVTSANDGKSEKSDTSTAGEDASQWRAMADKVRGIVLQELVTQKRPGGALYR